MLKLENIWKTFNAGTVNEKVALSGLNLHIKEGEFITVIGGNGAGKSTMLNAIAGVFGVDEGKIVIDGGKLMVSAGDDAVHSDASLTAESCDVTVINSYEGLEAPYIAINSGNFKGITELARKYTDKI